MRKQITMEYPWHEGAFRALGRGGVGRHVKQNRLDELKKKLAI